MFSAYQLCFSFFLAKVVYFGPLILAIFLARFRKLVLKLCVDFLAFKSTCILNINKMLDTDNLQIFQGFVYSISTLLFHHWLLLLQKYNDKFSMIDILFFIGRKRKREKVSLSLFWLYKIVFEVFVFRIF